MNVNSINTNFAKPVTSFGCSDPNCKCQAGVVSANNGQPKDTLEITQEVAQKTTSFGKKVVNGAKSVYKFFKDHGKQTAVGTKILLDAILTACTVIGANEMLKNTIGLTSTSKGLVNKLATIAGAAVATSGLVKNKDVFFENKAKKQ